MTSCACASLPEAFFLEDAPREWLASLRREARGHWKSLERCPSCRAAFVVDACDKGHHQVVVRVHDVSSWQTIDDEDLRKCLLLRSRGGLQGGSCIWSGCSQPRVRDVAYCLDHLRMTGAQT